MTKRVAITIEGVQIGEEEPVLTKAYGTYHYINDKHYIQYDEKSPEDGTITKNTMKISQSNILLTKKASQTSQMEFDLKAGTRMQYHTPYGSFPLEITTKSILLKEVPGLIEVDLKYSLSTNDSHLSDNSIVIRIIEEA